MAAVDRRARATLPLIQKSDSWETRLAEQMASSCPAASRARFLMLTELEVSGKDLDLQPLQAGSLQTAASKNHP